MYRTNLLLVLACILLSACGGGSQRNTSNKTIDPPAQQDHPGTQPEGSDLYAKYGCFTCHSLDGRVMYGPALNDLYMKEVTVVREGREKTIVADREYLTRAITDPEYEKVSEYEQRIMPVPEISEEEVATLVDYLIGLGKEE